MKSLTAHLGGRAKIVEIVGKRLDDEIWNVSSTEITTTESFGFNKTDAKFFTGGE